jgi:hypothetical protein
MKGVEVSASLSSYVSTSGRLSALGALTAQVESNTNPPVLARIKYKGGSGKLSLYGNGYQTGVRAIVGLTGYSVKKKGDHLLALVPKSAFPPGVAVTVKLRNPDGGLSQPITLTR